MLHAEPLRRTCVLKAQPWVCRERFIPATDAYGLGACLRDMLDTAARLLPLGGRLVFWMPDFNGAPVHATADSDTPVATAYTTTAAEGTGARAHSADCSRANGGTAATGPGTTAAPSLPLPAKAAGARGQLLGLEFPEDMPSTVAMTPPAPLSHANSEARARHRFEVAVALRMVWHLPLESTPQ